jgi:hypothetical protein
VIRLIKGFRNLRPLFKFAGLMANHIAACCVGIASVRDLSEISRGLMGVMSDGANKDTRIKRLGGWGMRYLALNAGLRFPLAMSCLESCGQPSGIACAPSHSERPETGVESS